MSDDTLSLAQILIARRSLTPADDGCQEILIDRLEKLGFRIEKMRFGEVDNLWARRGTSGPLLTIWPKKLLAPRPRRPNSPAISLTRLLVKSPTGSSAWLSCSCVSA